MTYPFELPKCDPTAPDRDVHTEHCCVIHGCKYCEEDCPVILGQKVQSWLCEDCDNDTHWVKDEIESLSVDRIKYIISTLNTELAKRNAS